MSHHCNESYEPRGFQFWSLNMVHFSSNHYGLIHYHHLWYGRRIFYEILPVTTALTSDDNMLYCNSTLRSTYVLFYKFAVLFLLFSTSNNNNSHWPFRSWHQWSCYAPAWSYTLTPPSALEDRAALHLHTNNFPAQALLHCDTPPLLRERCNLWPFSALLWYSTHACLVTLWKKDFCKPQKLIMGWLWCRCKAITCIN